MSAGIVGLTLTYAKMLTGGFQWCVRQSAEVENLVCGTILSFLTSVFFRRRMLQKSYVVFSAIRGTDEIGSPKGTVTGSYSSPGGGVGEFYLCHNKIYLILPQGSVKFLFPPPLLGSESAVIFINPPPPLYSLLVTNDSPLPLTLNTT